MWQVPYEFRVRIAVGVLFIFILASTLNAIRFISESRHSQEQEWSYRTAASLETVADFLRNSTAEKLQSTRLREIAQLAGFTNISVVETEALQSDEQITSHWIVPGELEELRREFGLEKEVIGRFSEAPPALATVPEESSGGWNRYLFQPFTTAAGENLTIVAQTDAEFTAHLDRFWWLTLLFEFLSLAAATAVAALLMQITFAPYKRIRKEAIAASVAKPETAESVDFAVDTFQKVIADLKAKEQRLQMLYARQRERTATLERYNDYVLESMPSGVLSCSVTTELTQVNRAAARMLHIDPLTTVGENYRQALASLPQVIQLFDAALQTGEEIALNETSLPINPDTPIAVSMVCRLLRDDSGTVRGAMVLLNDLTKIKHLEAEVSWREQMAALGEMSAGLAHQLRNSLGAMVGFGQLLKRLTQGSGQSEQIAGSILSEAESTERMLREFLGYSSPGEVKRTEIRLQEVFDDLKTFFGDAPRNGNIRLEIESGSADTTALETDPLLLCHTIRNLIQNGIEACDASGGEVVVSSEIETEESQLIIKVRDTGKGISPENLGKVFNPFFTSGKARGTGLGLALARKWIAGLGGEIGCASKTGQGSTFTITLPLGDRDLQPDPSVKGQNEVAKVV